MMTTPEIGTPVPIPLRAANFNVDGLSAVPAGVVSGDLLIAFHFSAGAANRNTIAGWTEVVYIKTNGVGMAVMLAKISDGTETGNINASTHGQPWNSAVLAYDAGATSLTAADSGYQEVSKSQLSGITVLAATGATKPFIMVSVQAGSATDPAGNLIYTPTAPDQTHGQPNAYYKTKYFDVGDTPVDQTVSITGDYGVQFVGACMLELT